MLKTCDENITLKVCSSPEKSVVVGLKSDVVGIKTVGVGSKSDAIGLKSVVDRLQSVVVGLKLDVVGLQSFVDGPKLTGNDKIYTEFSNVKPLHHNYPLKKVTTP